MSRQNVLENLKYLCWGRVQRLCMPKGWYRKLREIVKKSFLWGWEENLPCKIFSQLKLRHHIFSLASQKDLGFVHYIKNTVMMLLMSRGHHIIMFNLFNYLQWTCSGSCPEEVCISNDIVLLYYLTSASIDGNGFVGNVWNCQLGGNTMCKLKENQININRKAWKRKS